MATERQRVHDMAASGFSTERAVGTRDTRDGVILDSISKTFGAGKNKKKAVRSLAVGMPRGQCFGLLGRALHTCCSWCASTPVPPPPPVCS